MTEEAAAVVAETAQADEDAVVTETEVVEAEAETTEEVGEEKAEQDEKPEDSSTSKKDKKDSVQERIDELTRLRRETERDRDYWKEQAKLHQPKPKEPEIKPIEPGKTLSDFDYDEAKFAEYVTQQAFEQAKQAVKQEAQHETLIRKRMEFQAKEAEFVSKHDDYLQVAHALPLPITEMVAAEIMQSDTGPALLYHLGKNPDVATKLASLDPVSLAREIGKLDVKIASQPSKPSVTQAPAPAPKIAAVEPSIQVKASAPTGDKLSADEWLKRRNKELKARA